MESIVHLKTHYDYFSDLQKEYKFVEDSIGKNSDKKKEFTLVNNFSESWKGVEKRKRPYRHYEHWRGSLLRCGDTNCRKNERIRFRKNADRQHSENKKMEVSAFYDESGYWLLAINWQGHATSFKPPINGLVNQNKGKDKGITPLGWHVIRQLLSKENGKRILIDTKHMSVASRIEYYQFIRNYNFVNPNDKIPILSSHAGVNGYATMESSIREKDVIRKARRTRLYKWSINLSNEEINYPWIGRHCWFDDG